VRVRRGCRVGDVGDEQQGRTKMSLWIVGKSVGKLAEQTMRSQSCLSSSYSVRANGGGGSDGQKAFGHGGYPVTQSS